MSFGDILEAWERGRRPAGSPGAGPGGKRPPDNLPAVDMDAALDRYPPTPESVVSRSEADGDEERAAQPAARRNLEPQAQLDLHGMKGAEAEEALERFLREASARGLTHVLIIHGKGHHSAGEPVLPRTVRAYLEKCPFAGAFGAADRRQGGRGATWVALRSAASARGR